MRDWSKSISIQAPHAFGNYSQTTCPMYVNNVWKELEFVGLKRYLVRFYLKGNTPSNHLL